MNKNLDFQAILEYILTLLRDSEKANLSVAIIFKSISKKLQFAFVSFRRFVKSPFLYLGLATLICGSLVVFLSGRSGSGLSFAQDVLDDSQYLIFGFNAPNEQAFISMTSGNILQPVAPPSLVQGRVLALLEESGGYESDRPKKEIEIYSVQKGDTVSSVALRFGISSETLLWANNLTAKSLLKVGQELVILPVSGIMHMVQKGDTVSSIARLYQAKAQEIIDFNELGNGDNIKAGDFLIVPGGKKPKTVPKYNSVPLPNTYFILPIPSPCVVTQGLHWFNAVDLNNSRCGDPVFAAAAGEVQRTGFDSTGGNYVRVLHNNGAVTYYGHLSTIAVKAGQTVDQGQTLGYIGHTGYTIPAGEAGCHLHFDVRFAENPFAKYKVGAKLGR
ncbi:MAG: M23 family metallopeptidase [Candidatus Pacebacteria bacterium]|nr:M23 family metallopeptidase [Candidatus Paceibacterota bacterium]